MKRTDILGLVPISAAMASSADAVAFHTARPVWPAGRETEKNLFVGFRAVIDVPDGKRVLLRVTGSTVYRAFVNGAFCGYGPARGPHGYYRLDEWDVTGRIVPGKNLIALEVAGYNVNSYYLLDQPSFLQAEVTAGGGGLGRHCRRRLAVRGHGPVRAGSEGAALQLPTAVFRGVSARARSRPMAS